MENAVLHGQAVARVLQRLKSRGFVPDVVLGHPGWGETLYVKEIFPNTRLVHFCEWYYCADGADLGFDPEYPCTLDDRLRAHTWNALHLLNLETCDAGVTPTRWQLAQHPNAYQHKIAVAHEGIDLDGLQPSPTATVVLKRLDGSVVELKAGQPVVTYVARSLEPYRGFHTFLRALKRVQAQNSTCEAVIVGGDEVSYGRQPKLAKTWREQLQQEVRLDPARTHFVGRLPYSDYVKVLQISAAHVYLTYPFVLSWSLLEAMACGCLIVGSDTAPVREVVRDGLNGRLRDFFDPVAIAENVLEALERRAHMVPLREQARQDMLGYGVEKGLARYEQVLAAT